jgi:3-oxoacyl-ACP reductase-like protein
MGAAAPPPTPSTQANGTAAAVSDTHVTAAPAAAAAAPAAAAAAAAPAATATATATVKPVSNPSHIRNSIRIHIRSFIHNRIRYKDSSVSVRNCTRARSSIDVSVLVVALACQCRRWLVS